MTVYHLLYINATINVIFYYLAWLLATINVGKVQPSGSVSHLITEDEESRRPFVAADGDTASNSSQEMLYMSVQEPNGKVHYSKSYGSDN